MWWESDTLPCYYYLDRQLCSTTLPTGESPIQFQLKTTLEMQPYKPKGNSKLIYV